MCITSFNLCKNPMICVSSLNTFLHPKKLPKFTEKWSNPLGLEFKVGDTRSMVFASQHTVTTHYPRINVWDFAMEWREFGPEVSGVMKQFIGIKVTEKSNHGDVQDHGSPEQKPASLATPPGKNLSHWKPDSNRARRRHVGFLIHACLLF